MTRIEALTVCLAGFAPGVKWNPALVANFERMLHQHNYRLEEIVPPAYQSPQHDPGGIFETDDETVSS